MMRKSVSYVILSIAAAAMSLPAFADGGADTEYSPYSKFGIGTINRPGSAYIRSMGGTGVATRDNRYLNPMNPASVTARDSLSFMGDFSVSQINDYFRQGNITSADNTFNISHFAISFPIWRSSAMMLGISPYSSVGYDILDRQTDPNVIGYTGNINDTYSGTGSIYETYIAAGATFWKHFSFGAQLNYYFGTLEKSSTRTFSLSTYRSIYSGAQMVLRGCTAKLGFQYEQPLGKMDRLVAGVTYRFKTKLGGENSFVSYAVQSDVTDTLTYSNPGSGYTGADIPSELSVGISYQHSDKLRTEANFTWADWTKSNMDKVDGFKTSKFTSATRYSVNLGVEYTPNRGDIRYYMRRCSYRVGAYYTNEHYKYSGSGVASYGITLGMTMPVFRWYNGLSLSLELGQRSGTTSSMVRERYAGISVGLNIFDIWFVKPRYE